MKKLWLVLSLLCLPLLAGDYSLDYKNGVYTTVISCTSVTDEDNPRTVQLATELGKGILEHADKKELRKDAMEYFAYATAVTFCRGQQYIHIPATDSNE